MKLAVVIPTVGRKEMAREVLRSLASQTRPPDEVVVSAPDAGHVEQTTHESLRVSYVFGPRGTTVQRNRALDECLATADVISFFDDDFLPAADYLETVERLIHQHPEWKVLTGRVVLDGARSGGYSIQQGRAALAAAEAERATPSIEVAETVGGYGCNMSMRSADIGDHRFDERLPLYGWQEDIDFSRRVGRGGKIIATSELIGVHLGHKSGRVSGERFGYSQIANPLYLIRKGTMPPWYALKLMGRNLTANLVGSVWPEAHIDRRGRLKGNFHAAYHALRGRIDPEFVLKLREA